MRLKQGVRIHGIRPEIILAIHIIDGIYNKFGQELVITSGIEGKHSETSDHYKGMAVDCRTRYFSELEKQEVFKEVTGAIGDDFYTLLHETHLHISYRPRRLI